MKYKCSITINLPIERVVDIWQDESTFDQWQDGFQSIELLEGEVITKGAKSKIILEGPTRIELIETILIADLPREKVGVYEHKHMVNTMYCHFEKVENDKTLFQMEIEYTKFIGFMPKLMAFLMPSMFRKQSQKWLDQFKEFAESYEA